MPFVHPAVCTVTGLLFLDAVLADVVTTKDGARLVGHVQQMTQSKVQLVTGYAGTITIDTTHIERLETATPLTLRSQDGALVTGLVTVESSDAARDLSIDGDSGRSRLDFTRMLAAWKPGAEPPAEAGIRPAHKWSFKAGADIAGKEGNTDEWTTHLAGEALLVNGQHELRLYGSYEWGEQNEVENADQLIGGANYTNFFTDDLGWYVRGEAERDEFEDIDLRLTAANGLTWRVMNSEAHTLQFLGGVGYRHESFEHDSDSESLVLDIGLKHRLVLRDWLVMTNSLEYTPQLDDFADYLFVHDSAFELPIGTGPWTLRLGMRNDYKSETASGRKKLDTAHYSRLQVRF